MPNWVKHNFTVTGPSAVIAAFIAECFTRNEDSSLRLDFEKVIPYPEGFDPELPAGSSEHAYDAYYRPERLQSMLNWPWVVQAGVTDAEGLVKLLEERHAKAFEAANAYPTLRDLADAYAKNVEVSGHMTWYSWNSENWGTKWNACDCTVELTSDTEINLFFETAWGSPKPIFDAILQRYPDLRFNGYIDEEGGYFYAIVTDNAFDFHDGTREGGPYDYGDDGEELLGSETTGEASWNVVATRFCETAGDM